MAIVRLSQKEKTRRKISYQIKQSGRGKIKLVRSNRYLSALVYNAEGTLLFSVSSRSLVKAPQKSAKNKTCAQTLAKQVEEKCVQKGLKDLAFDRNAYKYHGVVAEFAQSLRASNILI